MRYEDESAMRDYMQEARDHELAAKRLEADAKHRRRMAEACRKAARYEYLEALSRAECGDKK